MKEIFVHCTADDMYALKLARGFLSSYAYPFNPHLERDEMGCIELDGLRIRFLADVEKTVIVKTTFKIKP